MAQMLGEFPNLAENPSSLPSIHKGWLTTACNSRFKAFSTLFRLLRTPHACACTSIDTHNEKIVKNGVPEVKQ